MVGNFAPPLNAIDRVTAPNPSQFWAGGRVGDPGFSEIGETCAPSEGIDGGVLEKGQDVRVVGVLLELGDDRLLPVPSAEVGDQFPLDQVAGLGRGRIRGGNHRRGGLLMQDMMKILIPRWWPWLWVPKRGTMGARIPR